MNPMKMMQQVQKMQADMARIQEELASRTYEASAGGGVVKAVATGDGNLQSIMLSPEIVTSGDVEMLQDLIVSAVQEAVKKGREEAQQEIGKLTAGLKIPGLGF
ncbi:MAG: YbaB/EbfC family nucleoid-associated protein [Candidatus Methylacidiphilales bacterium]